MLKEFGQDLKNLREAQNITIAEISAQTRINQKFINLMESGIFNFQPETYIRAFLKEYAKCVDVNENVLLTDYEKAKSGFYMSKSASLKKQEDRPLSIKPVIERKPESSEPKKEQKSEAKEKASQHANEKWPPPEIRRREPDDDSKEFSNKTLTQKILLGLLILVIIAGIVYLIDYLTSSGSETTNVKPKSFSEISEDYENKIKGKTNKDSTAVEDSLKNVRIDSLKLAIVASKDVRIKVYVDEKRIVEDVIAANDTMVIAAKDQFRFSASANNSVDLYLNGKLLKKPSSITGSTLKNLVINKDGIVNE